MNNNAYYQRNSQKLVDQAKNHYHYERGKKLIKY